MINLIYQDQGNSRSSDYVNGGLYMYRSRKAGLVRALAGIAVAVAGFIGASPGAHAYVYSSEGQWAQWSQGSWTIYNDVWGNSNPSQWLNVSSINEWNIATDQTGGGVKSYSNTQADPYTALTSMKSATATFNLSSPGSGSVYDWIFDAWTGTSSGLDDEIEVYESWTTPTGGWGKEIYSNVTVGDSTFSQVWQVNDGHNIVMFFRSSQRTSGTEDLLAIFNWCKSKNLLTNQNFGSFPFGVEVTSTNGWQDFYLNSYHASWSSTSGGSSI
jgi:hypothetical protein